MAKTNPAQFIQQVRTEVGKVSWPSRREVMLTTMMVLFLAGAAALFFSLTDWGIRSILEVVLRFFGS